MERKKNVKDDREEEEEAAGRPTLRHTRAECTELPQNNAKLLKTQKSARVTHRSTNLSAA